MESDDDDFDIDDILQGLDLDAEADKGSKSDMPTAKSDNAQDKEPQKDILSIFQAQPAQKPGLVSAGAANKSVRFSDKPPPSASAPGNKPSAVPQNNPIAPIVKNPQSNPVKRPAAKSPGKDWLGIEDDDHSPIATPPQQRPTSGVQQKHPPPTKPQTVLFDSDEETSDANDDMMKALGLKPFSKGTITHPAAKPESLKLPQTTPSGTTAPRYASQTNTQTQSRPSPPLVFSLPTNANPSKSGPSSLELFQSAINAPATAPASAIPIGSRDSKQSSSAPPMILQQQQPTSVLEALPFLNTSAVIKPQAQPEVQLQSSQVPPTENMQSGTGSVAKKKVVRTLAQGVGGTAEHHNTLSLPSHLIDQEQLKTMSSNLKSLYETQMEMLEKSYGEQIDFVLQSSQRKELVLLEEMKAMQQNYDQRIEKLKNELTETENQMPQKLRQELNSIVHNLSVTTQKTNTNENTAGVDRTGLMQDIDKSIDNKLATFGKNLEDLIANKLQVSQSSSADSNRQMENVLTKLEELAKLKDEDMKRVQDKIDESDYKLQSDVRKLIREQQKMKEKIIKAAMGSISHAMRVSNEDNLHKKEKTTSQVKEFRKELRRLTYEFEVKNDSMHKSQLSIEMEQKNISQTIRDLNSFLHSHSIQANNSTSTNNNNAPNQMAAMQVFQQQAQNEMEMKLLREERNSLSESIAKIQVERHKLNEERVLLERDKLELEREKNRVRDLEVQLRVKVVEAEEKILQAEAMRREESQNSKEIESKMREMQSNQSYMKDQINAAEQKLHLREQKFYEEKTEMMREKDFLDKLRDQLLCPGCLKSLTVPSSVPAIRSAGDGLDLTNLKLPTQSTMFNAATDESKFLDQLYKKQFVNVNW